MFFGKLRLFRYDDSIYWKAVPLSKLSKESYKERNAAQSQTITGLGKWWGRKPLVLERAQNNCPVNLFGYITNNINNDANDIAAYVTRIVYAARDYAKLLWTDILHVTQNWTISS